MFILERSKLPSIKNVYCLENDIYLFKVDDSNIIPDGEIQTLEEWLKNNK